MAYTESTIFIVPSKQFFFKLLRRHIEVSGYTFDILRGVGGRHGLAAIGAAHTVNHLPHIPIHLIYQLRKIDRHYFVQFFEEFDQLWLLFLRLLIEFL